MTAKGKAAIFGKCLITFHVSVVLKLDTLSPKLNVRPVEIELA